MAWRPHGFLVKFAKKEKAANAAFSKTQFLEHIFAHDALLAVGANADHRHWNARLLLDEVDIILRAFGQILKFANCRKIAAPALELLVDGLHLGEQFEGGRVVVVNLACG